MNNLILKSFLIMSVALLAACGGENNSKSSRVDNGDDITTAFKVEIDENSIVDISSLNADSYQISGTCDIGLGDVNINVSAPSQSQTVLCDLGNFAAVFDLRTITSANLNVIVEQNGESDTPQAAPANDQSAAAVTILSATEINYSNYLSYKASGECSENGQQVSVVIGTVPAFPQPFCNNNVWSTLGTNVSSLVDGPVIVRVDHSDQMGNAANQATRTVNKNVIVPSIISAPSAPKDPNWTLKIRPGDIPVVTSSNASSLRFAGYCASGQGDVTIRYGSITTSTECDGFFGAYGINIDVSGETVMNPVQHCASQSISSLICASPVTNELAPPGLNFSVSPLPKIAPNNEANYKITGTCAPVGASILIDIDSELGVLSGACLSRNKFDISGNVSSVSDGVNLNLTASITADSVTTSVSELVSKGVQVDVNTPDDIIVDNFMSYSLSGSCSDNGEDVILNIGGYMPNPQPVCTNNFWSLVNIDLSSVSEGAVVITVNHIDNFGNAAVEQTVNIFKDMMAPTVSILSAQNIGLSNQSSYSLNGECSEDGRAVILNIGGLIPGSQPLCSSGLWSISNINVSTVGVGNILIAADHDDLIGNEADQATSIVVKDTTAPLVAFNTVDNITSVNESSYSLSGSCSENGRAVNLNIGGVAPSSQPVCISGAWELLNIDVSSLPQGLVVITANHSDIANNQALEALVSIGKYDPINLNILSADCADPYTSVASFTFLGEPSSAYNSISDTFSVSGVSNWRTLNSQEALPDNFEISFTINNDTRQMVGFSNTPTPSTTWSGIESLILFYDNTQTYSYANGTFLGSATDISLGGFPAEVRIEKIGNTAIYYVNENIFRIDSTIPLNQDMYLTFAGLTGYTADYENLRVKDLTVADTGFFISGTFSDPNGSNGPYELYDNLNDVVIGQVASSPFELQYNSGLNGNTDIQIRSVATNVIASDLTSILLNDCLKPLSVSISGASCSGPVTSVSTYSFLGNPTSNYNSSTDTLLVTGSASWNTLNAQEPLPQDFKISYTIPSDTRQMMGFSNTTIPSNTWTGLESVILFYDDTFTYSYANGTYLGNESDANMGGFPADIRVEKIGTTVTYYMNNNVFRVDNTIPATEAMYLTFGGSTSAYTAVYQGMIVEDISTGVTQDFKITGGFVDPNGIGGIYEVYDVTNDVVIAQVSASPFEVVYSTSLSSPAQITVRRQGSSGSDSNLTDITLDPCN